MTNVAQLRVGWCPGALRPMLAGDGFLVRIKPHGGCLSTANCLALANLGQRFGNGLFDVTARCNLQIRGVATADLPALIADLSGLGLLDPTPEGEAVRNIVSSPLAGVDPTALIDIRPVTAALEQRLVEDPAMQRLPAKFSWVLDDGGRLPLGTVPADVRFTAVRRPGAPVFQVGLASTFECLAECAATDVPDVAAALATAYRQLCAEAGQPAHRMRDLTATVDPRAVAARAGLRLLDTVKPKSGRGAGASRSPETIGLFAEDGPTWLGVAPPFGKLSAEALANLAMAGARAGVQQLCFTPWRTVLAAGIDRAAAERLWQEIGTANQQAAPGARLIVDPADSRLSIAACTGAPACHRGTTPVQNDALRLAAALRVAHPGEVLVHVSGCSKGCARAEATPLTIVGHEGRYDLVRNGMAGDAPERSGLPIEELAAMLAAPADASATARFEPSH